jgi:hypothetical protein
VKQRFEDKNLGREARELIAVAVEIIENYEAQGYKLSLRQLYYQLVSKNVVPNTEQSYKRVGCVISDARRAGMVDWEMIEDRNRSTITPTHWDSPAQIVEAVARQYRIDKWATQPHFCEVMVEKQALEGVLEPVCNELDIPFTSNKGYTSDTMVYNTGRKLMLEFMTRCAAMHKDRVAPLDTQDTFPDVEDRRDVLEFMQWVYENGFADEGRLTEEGIEAGFPRIVVFYMGDHDPSGIDMTRDVADRLRMFSDHTPIEVRRLALNMPQIEELNPPENPAKMTDSRATKYVERFGTSSWELDAVEPTALADLVREAVGDLRNETLWEEAVERERKERDTLKKVSDQLTGKGKKKK